MLMFVCKGKGYTTYVEYFCSQNLKTEEILVKNKKNEDKFTNGLYTRQGTPLYEAVSNPRRINFCLKSAACSEITNQK